MELEGIAGNYSSNVAECSDYLSKRPPVWHNAADGERVKMLFSSMNEIRRRPYWTYEITLSVIGAIALLSVPAARAQNAPQRGEKNEASPAGNAETGKRIFTKDGCYECHGREGQGAAQGAGPRIGPLQLSYEAFAKYVHQPTGQMPPYTSKVLSDQDLADIYAYLQSRPRATPSKDIPLLNK